MPDIRIRKTTLDLLRKNKGLRLLKGKKVTYSDLIEGAMKK